MSGGLFRRAAVVACVEAADACRGRPDGEGVRRRPYATCEEELGRRPSPACAPSS